MPIRYGQRSKSSSKESTKIHNALQSQILIALTKQGLGMFWSNATGAARTLDGEWVRYGLVGSSDILGIVNGGFIVCIEVKTGLATQSEQQVKFEAAIKKRGGHYFVVRSVDEALKFVAQVAASRNAG